MLLQGPAANIKRVLRHGIDELNSLGRLESKLRRNGAAMLPAMLPAMSRRKFQYDPRFAQQLT
jgi:hypothetical protein